MRRWHLVALLAGLPVIGVVACAQPPASLVEAARELLRTVAEEGAIYAPEEYAAAQDAGAELETELQVQQGKFALFRSYDRATELAAAVEMAAAEVRVAIEAEKQRLRTEAENMVANAQRALADARRELEDLPEDEASALQREVAAVDTLLGEVADSLASEQFGEAYQQAESGLEVSTQARASAAKLQATLEEARQAAVTRAIRGTVDIPRAVLADGERLVAGAYQVRLTDDSARPVGPEGPDRTRWVDLVRGETVVARALAVVIPDEEVGEVAESHPPRNEARIDDLKGGEYVRLWLNRDGMNYLVHMPNDTPLTAHSEPLTCSLAAGRRLGSRARTKYARRPILLTERRYL